jgi:hypothetical protein
MRWYVRKGGSDNNGGTSNSTTPERSGADMSVTNGSATVTSASAAFVAGDIGKGINIAGVIYRIAGVTNGTTATLERNYGAATGGSKTWAIGGALLTIAKVTGTSAALLLAGDPIVLGGGAKWRETLTISLTSPADRSGTDGVTTARSRVFTSATAAFTSADVGRAIAIIDSGGRGYLYTIRAVTNGTTVTLDDPADEDSTGRTWRFVNAFIGDFDGALTGDAGVVTWTAYTTSDKAAPGAIFLNPNSKSRWGWKGILFVAGSGTFFNGGTVTDQYFTRCAINALRVPINGNIFAITVAAGVPANLHLASVVGISRYAGSGQRWLIVTANRHTADYDVGIRLANCNLNGGTDALQLGSTGAGAGLPGGMRADSCTFVTNRYAMTVIDANCSTTIPCAIYGSALFVGSGLNATTLGQIVESNNLIHGDTPRTNVAVGAGSISDLSYAPEIEFGQAALFGIRLRPLFMPAAASPLLGFGSVASAPLRDLFGASRPAGGGSALLAAGAYERGDTETIDLAMAPPGGTASAKLTGPGYFEREIAVDPVPTTLKVYVRREATYAGALPSVRLRNGTDLGIDDADYPMTAAVDTWEQLTIGPFTPAAKGIITLRFRSYDTNGAAGVWYGRIDPA